MYAERGGVVRKPLLAKRCRETLIPSKGYLPGIAPRPFQSENRPGAWIIMDKVLVLSEDETASGFLRVILQREPFFPILANSRDAALQSICTLQPDVLIIDAPLAGIAPIELCLQLQMFNIAKSMIVLGDSSEEIDKVLALEAGADYYMVKPFSPRELIARLRALLRRRRANLDAVIRFGNVEVDRQRRTVTCRGQDIKVTACEYELLLLFLAMWIWHLLVRRY
jgi:DNA-binding response OmpR family regulator